MSARECEQIPKTEVTHICIVNLDGGKRENVTGKWECESSNTPWYRCYGDHPANSRSPEGELVCGKIG